MYYGVVWLKFCMVILNVITKKNEMWYFVLLFYFRYICWKIKNEFFLCVFLYSHNCSFCNWIAAIWFEHKLSKCSHIVINYLYLLFQIVKMFTHCYLYFITVFVNGSWQQEVSVCFLKHFFVQVLSFYTFYMDFLTYLDRCLFFCTFSFGHCVVCPLIYRFWLPLWYLHALLTFDSMWTFWVKTNFCRFFIVCLYMYCCWRSSYQKARAKVPLTDLIPPHFCACPSQARTGFPTSYVIVFLCSVSWGENWLLILLILVELLTITF